MFCQSETMGVPEQCNIFSKMVVSLMAMHSNMFCDLDIHFSIKTANYSRSLVLQLQDVSITTQAVVSYISWKRANSQQCLLPFTYSSKYKWVTFWSNCNKLSTWVWNICTAQYMQFVLFVPWSSDFSFMYILMAFL